jgi:hypothetical protein
MSFKLNKNEEDQFARLKTALAAKHVELTTAINTYNKEVNEAVEPLQEMLQEYNKYLNELRSFVETVAEDKRGEFEDKSDTWKEGDTGSGVDAWLSAWESAELEEVTIEFPPEIEIEFDNHSEIDLPSEP